MHPAAHKAGGAAFTRARPAARPVRAAAPKTVCMASGMQFIKGIDEPTIPEVKLTRSRDGSSGTGACLIGCSGCRSLGTCHASCGLEVTRRLCLLFAVEFLGAVHAFVHKHARPLTAGASPVTRPPPVCSHLHFPESGHF